MIGYFYTDSIVDSKELISLENWACDSLLAAVEPRRSKRVAFLFIIEFINKWIFKNII